MNMINNKAEFLYLTEEETIKSGITDMSSCIKVMEEVFELLSLGDYVMGGENHNSHGVEITFPDESPFPNMPLNTPDRRFMAMCAYLGGRFDICGEKWYGSNIDNKKIGLPRSVHTVILNDQRTGIPISIMPGNLISSMRTGAVPGVGAKYLAKDNASTLALIGAGVISKTCAIGILTACRSINQIYIYDVMEAPAKSLSEYLQNVFTIRTNVVDSIEEAVINADIINTATSGATEPFIDSNWIKPGSLLSLPAAVDIPKEFILNSKIVVDNWKLYESWREEFRQIPKTYHEIIELIGGDLIDYVNDGILDADDFIELGDIITCKIQGRESEDENIIFAMGGMPVEDVAWAYQVFLNAKQQNLGTLLKFWDRPYML